MYCPNCGTQNADDARYCTKCGKAVQADAETFVRSNVALTTSPTSPQLVIVKHAKNAGLAAVLSFFWCGLGQIYNGEIGKGILFMIVYGISLVLIMVLVGFVTTPILWIWGMVDAYRAAERMNRADSD
jgi:TM2 domain-containing membrane protein YozV